MTTVSAPLARHRRFWEVDTLRGIAIVLMIFYHFMWDLSFFGLSDTNMLSSGWQSFARSIGSTFLFVMGVSLTLSFNLVRHKYKPGPLFLKFLRRGATIFGWGLVITGATYFFIGPGFVVFGILHLIGAAIILAYPFLYSKWAALLGTVVLLAAGPYVDGLVSQSPWLLWLGVKEAGRSMVDYYPLVPWFGVSLLGVFAGHLLYPQRQARLSLPDLSDLPPVRGLVWLGRHSLAIYLIHQPLIIGALFAFTWLME